MSPTTNIAEIIRVRPALPFQGAAERDLGNGRKKMFLGGLPLVLCCE